MTDNEIIKALEYCYADKNNCKRCPYMAVDKCHKVHTKDTLDLINRLQAENERLKRLLDDSDGKYNLCAKRFYKEGVKEFAERVKLEFYYEFDELIPSIMADKIDNLLKELVGE